LEFSICLNDDQPAASTVDGTNVPPVAPAAPYLSHELASATSNADGSTTYSFLVSSWRPAGSTFTDLQQCAWDATSGGNSLVAAYSSTVMSPVFSAGSYTLSVTVHGSDAICDELRLRGVDSSDGLPFTDYSNVVAAPTATSCEPIQLTMSQLASLTPWATIAAANGCSWVATNRQRSESVSGYIETATLTWDRCGGETSTSSMLG
jgi:hypothetical protein